MAKTQTDLQAIAGYAGEYAETIILAVMQALDITKDVSVLTNLKTSTILPKYVASEGLRPYSSAVKTPKGQSGTFSARRIDPRTAMKILDIIPEEFRDTYLARGLAANAKDYPQGFGQYFWLAQILKIAEEINDNIYLSIDPKTVAPFDATVNYTVGSKVFFEENYYQVVTATTAGQTPTSVPASFLDINNKCLGIGFGTIIAQEYNSLPAANRIATGIITDTNAFDKVSGMYKAMPSKKQALGGTAFVSYNTYQNYQSSLLNKFTNGTSAYEVPGKPGMLIFGSDGKWNVQAASWMGNSGRIIMTQPKKNMFMGTDQLPDLTTVGNMIPHIHGFLAKFQMILACQFADMDTLFVNDQA
ncbi:hypothetical protein [Spirosoma rhododendri]|uniref:Phage major capsid protein n=1 Tax=Spirosoma rhododendri TaxID=2728024 RepID=A0A7L5DM36_9BACT|nr:hypothetical protein [Spirosoma rhododendri]QJD79529.1 hypothetical protein HH216_14755 [Spirosoma rhododendri]